MKKIEFLETERLILRPFTLEDKYDMFEYAKNPEVGPNAGGHRISRYLKVRR